MAEWDESKHPRVPSGDVNGGQFTDKQVSAAAGAAREAAGLDKQHTVKFRYGDKQAFTVYDAKDRLVTPEIWWVE